MREITKERADELDAAWQAASDSERLSLNRMSWLSVGDSTSYYEEQPTKLETFAAGRIAELEAALRPFARYVVTTTANTVTLPILVADINEARRVLGKP